MGTGWSARLAFAAVGILLLGALPILRADDTPAATVNTPTLQVHENASESSDVVKVLKKGDKVVVGVQIQNSESIWCEVREPNQNSWLGFVTCRSLDLPPPPEAPKETIAVRTGATAPVQVIVGRPATGRRLANGRGSATIPAAVLDQRFVTSQVDAPDFALTDLDGHTHELSDLRGSYVLLDLFATWCPPCRMEMPEIEKLHQEVQDSKLKILSIDAKEPRPVVRRFFERTGYTYPILLDPDDQVAYEYSARYIPTLVIIDPIGKVRFYDSGVYSAAELRAILAQIGMK